MKRLELVSTLERAGCKLLQHGGKHDIYHNPISGKSQPVPRHREISERLAQKGLSKSLQQDNADSYLELITLFMLVSLSTLPKKTN